MRRSVLVLAVLFVTSTIACVRPAYAVGNPGGANLDCVPGSPQLIVQHGTLTRVSGSDTLNCPPPGAPPGQSFGPTGHQTVSAPPPQPGTPCHFEYQSPLQFQMGGTGGYLTDAQDPRGSPPPTWNDPGFQDLASLYSRNGATGAENLYKQAGTSNFYAPWAFDGVWNAQGQCVAQPPPNPNNPNAGWTTPCRLNGTGTFPGCLNQVNVFVAGPLGGVPVAALGENLQALVQGRITGGVITSLPDRNHPGLTNLRTCFYISNMTVDGQPLDPQQDVWWEKVVVGQAAVDPFGRHVVYVFRIHVTYKQTVWHFDDGTELPIGKAGQSPEPLPADCRAIANQQFEVAHTYHKYSHDDGYHVTVNHQFGVDVSEYWWDSNGANHVDFPNAIPPVTVPALPQPYYPKPIIQEEGVPVST